MQAGKVVSRTIDIKLIETVTVKVVIKDNKWIPLNNPYEKKAKAPLLNDSNRDNNTEKKERMQTKLAKKINKKKSPHKPDHPVNLTKKVPEETGTGQGLTTATNSTSPTPPWPSITPS